MDPVANLNEQLTLAKELLGNLGVDVANPAADTQRRITFEERTARLAELVLALDEWRRKGGFDPYSNEPDRFERFMRAVQSDDDTVGDVLSRAGLAEGD